MGRAVELDYAKWDFEANCVASPHRNASHKNAFHKNVFHRSAFHKNVFHRETQMTSE